MEIIELSEDNFKERISSDKKILIDFYAVWCGPCKMMASVLDSIKEEIKDCEIYKVNVDECPNLAREYGVMSIPNLILFQNGKVVKNEMGFKTAEELKEFVEV
ncbi:MAG: thioredoxin [Bacilli bacterium]|nr:thioredoxin [Bacilli bacterium]